MMIIVRLSSDTASEVDTVALARQPLSTLVPGLTARLRGLGICHVRMEYSAQNGRGEFIHMEFLRTDGTDVRAQDPSVHATALQAIFGHLICFRHPKWLEGDGSTGDFRWDLTTDSLTHTHYLRGPNGNERVTHHDL
jgi:hypothetical protein